MALIDDLKNRPQLKRRGTQQIILLKDEIKESLEKGYSKKDIWELLIEKKRLSIGYSAFSKITKTLLTESSKKPINDKVTSTESKNNSPTEEKPKRKPIYAGSEKKKSFHHPATPPKDILKFSDDDDNEKEEPKPKRKPIYNPPEEKKGFVHNPISRKDLI